MIKYVKDKLLWIGTAIMAIVYIYFKGKSDGKQEQEAKTVKETLKMVKDKNTISHDIKSKPVDGLRYRD